MPAVTPVLRYRDPRRAVDFLAEAFGFSQHAVHEGESGALWSFGTYRPG